MGNPYQIQLEQNGGPVTFDGEATFTDPDNQPGGIASWGLASQAHFVGDGSPSGVVTPTAAGDLYIDNTTPALYQATGTGDTDWQLVGGGSVPFPTQAGAGSPNGTVTPTNVGSVYVDTTNGGIYVAAGPTSGDWLSVGGNADPTIPGVALDAGAAIIQLSPYPGETAVSANTGGLILTATRQGTAAAIQGWFGPGLTVTDDGADSQIGFFTATPVVQQAITGALSTVTDAAAKDVLTSIIAALVAYGLATDGTT